MTKIKIKDIFESIKQISCYKKLAVNLKFKKNKQ